MKRMMLGVAGAILLVISAGRPASAHHAATATYFVGTWAGDRGSGPPAKTGKNIFPFSPAEAGLSRRT